jgi:uncharacterized protein (DUF433 family)
MLGTGETEHGILEAFPSLNKNHIKAALKFASRITEGQQHIHFAPEYKYYEVLSR